MHVVPPEDFAFVESNGSVVRSPTKEGLVKAVTEYRELNGHEVGDVVADVELQITQNADRRRGIIPPAPAFQHDNIPAPRNLRERVTNWASNRFYASNKGIQYVTQDEADRRGAVCAECPYNVSWKIGCPPCVENNDRVLFLLNKGQKIKQSPKVSGCSHYGHDINTACFLPEDMLKHRVQMDPPDVPCWIKELDEGLEVS